jgi:hypothetical protein
MSCNDNGSINIGQNLQEYIDRNSHAPIGEVIACAASDSQNTQVSYIFYYPIIGATDIRFYETENTQVNSNDFSNYTLTYLNKEPVFGGKLARFIKSSDKEVWCMVTFKYQGALHRSNPIRLKQETKPTEWTDEVVIDFTPGRGPTFSWNDGAVVENVIYFQVFTDKQNNFLSGTYTYDKWFQYKNTSNVVLDINTETPTDLAAGEEYHFTMMGVSEDNWVNLVVQKPFTAQ